MNEKDRKVIPFPSKPKVNPVVPINEPKVIIGEVIDFSPPKIDEPLSTTIIFADDDDVEEFGKTMERYAQAPATMIWDDIPHATRDTGGVAIKVPLMALPTQLPATIRLEGNLLRNQAGIPVALTEKGNIRMIVISRRFPFNPLTLERLNPPGQETETPILPQTHLIDTPPSHMEGRNTTSQVLSTASSSSSLENNRFIRPLTDTELKRAA